MSYRALIKAGFGGTYLIDEQTQSVSLAYGNWCPPSSRDAGAADGITGKCYDTLLNRIDNLIAHYHEENKLVRLAGTFWMQGEAESGLANSGSYGTYLETFINDLRSDYATRFDRNALEAESLKQDHSQFI